MGGSNEVLGTGRLSDSSAWVCAWCSAFRHRWPSWWTRKVYRLPFLPSPTHSPHFGQSFSNCFRVPERVRVGVSVFISSAYGIALPLAASTASGSLATVIDGGTRKAVEFFALCGPKGQAPQ